MFDYAHYDKHPGRNPAHDPAGYSRPIYGNVPNKDGELVRVKVGMLPRNPSRWLPHVGGASAGARIEGVASPTVTRQQRRWVARKLAAQEARLEKLKARGRK